MQASNAAVVIIDMRIATASATGRPRRHGRRWLLAVAPVAFSLAVLLPACRPDATDDAFERCTDLRLSPGVHVVGHQRTMHDNLLHVGDRWWLSGSSNELARLTDGTDFVVSTEDARWVLPAVDGHGRRWTPAEVRIGFESDASRDDWYVVLGDGTTALYEDN